MSIQQINWTNYIENMENILLLKLDKVQKIELCKQLNHIATLAEPLMEISLSERIELAGVFHP